MNGIEDKLENWNKTIDFIVLDFHLLGLDTLWSICLYAKEEDVARFSVDYLNSLYEKLSPSLKKERGKLHEEYIQNIMKHTENAKKNQLEDQIIERCIDMLTVTSFLVILT